ncbi:hypothetical protein VNO78_00199 [Psophocarpus tetragonolobus]|uniref:Uncharacterized protein n=1 Tax=Psophocarpus tetragonolobus TaxID=3891 RepID=A0AAN9T033_PSOTE
MASSWRRTVGNMRSFVSNSMGGLRGGSNLASWVVAGTLAYFLWIKPSQDLKRQQQERAALASSNPDPQVPLPHPLCSTSLFSSNLIIHCFSIPANRFAIWKQKQGQIT